jgi:hypothetical protein
VVSLSAAQTQAEVELFHLATCAFAQLWGRLYFGSSAIVTSPLSPSFGRVSPPVTEIFVMSPPDRRTSVWPPVHADFGFAPS